MIQSILNTEFILASASPRRKEILSSFGFNFSVFPSAVTENFNLNVDPVSFAVHYAIKKAENVALLNPNSIIVGADTIVVKGDSIMGKPADNASARAMLRTLSGSTHRVITGVSIIASDAVMNFHEETAVRFKSLEEDEIEWYIASGEAMDKAGAYGIQGRAGLFIEKISGCYYNVVGFPVASFYGHFKKLVSGD